MKLKNMFKKDITRYIKGVIKAGQESEDIIYQELDEYVVTREIRTHLRNFYNIYNESLENETDEIGVWISGFFGSGKSHFLKILSYLLSNKEVKGKKAIEFFKEKIEDAILLADIERASLIKTETILFNIDAESSADAKSDKDAIVKVFRKMFYKNMGLYGENDEITNLEKYLYQFGKLEEFKNKYHEKFNEVWEKDGRRKFPFKKSQIKEIVAEIMNMTEEDKKLFDFKSLGNDTSIKNFAEEVKDYIEKKGDNFHIIFLVDEVGQYIGDNNNLILNLQTLSEELANHCRGKAWIIVTSQEDIDSITKVREKDFSKIQARFKTRLNLSSVSVSEVIQKRLLEKNSVAEDMLKVLYEEKNIPLKNAINFKNSINIFKGYSSQEEFVNLYPFIPYQTKLLQKVFEQVRIHGSSGKHLSEGERSMLSAFQEAMLLYIDKEEGILIPFDMFYDSIENFLASTIRRVFENAIENNYLNDFDIRVLKLLFMLKYLSKEMPPTIENLTTLMINNIDQDKIELKNKIQQSLNSLESQNLIEKNIDKYYFLTDEEQEINREIKKMELNSLDVDKKIIELIFDQNSISQKIRYNKINDFSYSIKINGNLVKYPNSELFIEIITSDNELYDEDIKLSSMKNQNTLYLKLIEDEKFIEEIKTYLKLAEYVKNKVHDDLSKTLKRAIEAKKDEIPAKEKRLQSLLKEIIKNSEFYINGEKIDVSGDSTNSIIENALKNLIEMNYPRMNYIEQSYTEKHLNAELKNLKIDLDGIDNSNNPKAIKEVTNYIQYYLSENSTVKDIIEYFSKIPFGWRKEDIVYCLIKLYQNKEIEFKYNREKFTHKNSDFLEKLLNRYNEKIEVRKKEKIDSKTLQNVKKLYLELFDESLEKDDTDEIAEVLKTKIKDEINILRDYLKECENNNFPGVEIINEGLKILKKVSLDSNYKMLFKTFLDLENEINDWKDEYEKIKLFLKDGSKQKELFIKGREYLKELDSRKNSINYDPVEKEITEIKNIINSSEPYTKMKNIPELIQKIENYEKEQLSKLKEEFKIEFENYFDSLLSESLKNEINSTKLKILNTIENENNIVILKANHHTWLNTIEELKDKIKEEKSKRIYPVIKDNPPVIAENVEIPIKIVKYIEIKEIKNEDDLEKFIENLKQNLLSEIKNGKILKIID
ncbi:BREX system P-loop protein BrxC [Marinitoga arctica]